MSFLRARTGHRSHFCICENFPSPILTPINRLVCDKNIRKKPKARDRIGELATIEIDLRDNK